MTGVPEDESSSDCASGDWDSSGEEFDYDNALCMPPGYTMIPISVAGPDDHADENGQALAAGLR